MALLLSLFASGYLVIVLLAAVSLLFLPVALWSPRPFFKKHAFRKAFFSILISLLLLSILLFPSWRIYTGIGILAFNGADHWVKKAATEPNDARATEYLAYVIRSSHKGVTAAELSANRLNNRQQRSRVFLLLSKTVPWPEWQERYLKSASSAGEGSNEER